MKILQLTQFFAPVHGGSAQVPYHLSRELARRGHEVSIYTSDYKISKDWVRETQKLGIEVYSFGMWLNIANLQITPGLLAHASKQVAGFDVIHMHNYRTFQNVIMHRYACKHKVPYILQAHGSLPRIVSKKGLKFAYDALWGYMLLGNASKVIAVTTTEAEQYKGMGVAEDRIEIVPDGIYLSEFENVPERGRFRRKHGLNSSQRLIIYLGRIHVVKGLDRLIRAFAELAGSLDDVMLVLAGPDDGYVRALRTLTRELGIEQKVLFTGPLYGADKLEAYVDADVYVLPSSYEIFGIAVLEALACATPVVISERCGIAQAIDGQAGLTFNYDDKGQLKQVLLRMLSDETMRQRFGNRGKQLVRERFSWESITARFERIYEKVRSNFREN
jgi:glycosyltransferase involved in cell wall biosynthesis